LFFMISARLPTMRAAENHVFNTDKQDVTVFYAGEFTLSGRFFCGKECKGK